MTNPKDELKAMTAALDALEPLSPDQQQRVVQWLGQTLGASSVIEATVPIANTATANSVSPSPAPARTQADMTPKKFLAVKSPTTDVERLTCLAYYLTKYRDIPQFKTAELESLNTEAAGRRFANAPNTAKNATTHKNYLTSAGGRERQITHLGEQVVEALPDREAVKAVIDAAPKPRKRSSRRRAKNKPKTRKDA